QHADAAGRTATSSAADRSVRNAGAAAGIEHGKADWHANDTATRIIDADHAPATFNQPACRPCGENERRKNSINPVKLDFEIPARPTHIWIAHMTIPHCHLQQFRVQLPLREEVARALPNSEQSEHWQECGRGKQYRGKLVITGSCP